MTALLPARPSPEARPSRIPATVWVLGIVSLLMDVSTELIQTLLPLYLVGTLGASVALVGFIEGLSVAVATLSKLASGVIADWTGRRKPLAVLGYGLGAVSKLIFPLAASVGWILAAKAIDRIGKGIRATARDALIADVTPPELRGASFGLRKSLDTVGGSIGPLAAIGLMLVFAGDVLTVYWVAVVPALLAVGLLAFGIREPAQPAGPAKDGPPRLADIVLLNTAAWLAILISCLLTAARFSEAFLLLKAQDAGFSAAWVPLTMVVMNAVYGLTAYPVGRLSDAIGRRGLLFVSLVLLVAAYLVLAAADSRAVFVAGIVLWGLHLGFSQGLLATLIADAAPEALRGTAFGVFNLMTGGVVLAGNVIAGLIWDAHGPSAAFMTGAGVSVVAMVMLGAVSLRRSSSPAG